MLKVWCTTKSCWCDDKALNIFIGQIGAWKWGCGQTRRRKLAQKRLNHLGCLSNCVVRSLVNKDSSPDSVSTRQRLSSFIYFFLLSFIFYFFYFIFFLFIFPRLDLCRCECVRCTIVSWRARVLIKHEKWVRSFENLNEKTVNFHLNNSDMLSLWFIHIKRCINLNTIVLKKIVRLLFWKDNFLCNVQISIQYHNCSIL